MRNARTSDGAHVTLSPVDASGKEWRLIFRKREIMRGKKMELARFAKSMTADELEKQAAFPFTFRQENPTQQPIAQFVYKGYDGFVYSGGHIRWFGMNFQAEALTPEMLKVVRDAVKKQTSGGKHPIRRKRNPTKAQVKSAATKIAKAAGRAAWGATKFTARTAGKSVAAGSKVAAREVKAAICKNPVGWEVRMSATKAGLKTPKSLVWTAQTKNDAIHIARVYKTHNPRMMVGVKQA